MRFERLGPFEFVQAILVRFHNAEEPLKHLAESGDLLAIFECLLRKIAHIMSEQLVKLRECFVPFGQSVQAFVDGHLAITPVSMETVFGHFAGHFAMIAVCIRSRTSVESSYISLSL